VVLNDARGVASLVDILEDSRSFVFSTRTELES
jgi:hypothetical protein